MNDKNTSKSANDQSYLTTPLYFHKLPDTRLSSMACNTRNKRMEQFRRDFLSPWQNKLDGSRLHSQKLFNHYNCRNGILRSKWIDNSIVWQNSGSDLRWVYLDDLIIGVEMINISSIRTACNELLKLLFCRRTVRPGYFNHKHTFTRFFNFNVDHEIRISATEKQTLIENTVKSLIKFLRSRKILNSYNAKSLFSFIRNNIRRYICLVTST